MTGKDSFRPFFPPTLGMKICILGSSFFIMFFVVSLCGGILANLIPDIRTSFLLTSTLQSVMAFIFPAWITAGLCYTHPSRYLRLSSPTAPGQYIAVIVFLILLTPVMNLIIDWNANVSIPVGSLEAMLREWENQAAKTTEIILGDTSLWGLLSGILIIGCLTGFAEEAFFRGGIQNALTSSGWNPHLSIWLTAFIFSAVHFQFFGFIPRLLLGAFFGYIFHYTGSLKVAAFGHALNNTTVVVSSWIMARGYTSVDLDKMSFSPLIITVSSILLILFSIFFAKKMLVKITK